MSFCTYAEGAALFDSTPIENLFITEYMPDATNSALKVYLYARMLALHPELGGSLQDIAAVLSMDEEEVYRAFTYWENRGLVRRLTDQPPTYAIQPVFYANQSAGNPLDLEMRANREFNNQLSALFDDGFIGQHEINKATEWRDTFKLDQDAIIRLLAYAKTLVRSKNPRPSSVFDKANKLMKDWSERGIHTLAEVERAIAEDTGEVAIAREILKKLGISRNPSEPDLAYIRCWIKDWGYDKDAILAACDSTTSAQYPTMKYLNSILENQRDEKQKHFGEVAAVLRELNPKSAQPTPDQLDRYAALIDQGFAPEMIRLAAVQCHRLNKERFDDLEWRLSVWRKDGVSTPGEADAYMRQMAALSRELREVFRRAGSEKRPAYGDLQTYRGWKDAYPAELIDYAAECAKGAGGSMAYMEKLLTQWKKDGAATLEQARVQHEAWKQSGRTADKPTNPALDYAQREYKDEDFGDDFYFDYDKVFGSEESKA